MTIIALMIGHKPATTSMPDDARMKMYARALSAVVTAVAGVATATGVITGPPEPTALCRRTVAIDPQVTVAESAGTLTFVVHTGSCSAAGSARFVVSQGSATIPADFVLGGGQLVWNAGDTTSRRITARIINDTVPEAPIEDFTVTLVSPSRGVRIAAATGQGRILDDDTGQRWATVDDRLCLASGESGSNATPPASTPPTSDPVGTCTIEPGHIMAVPIVLNTASDTSQSLWFKTSDGTLRAGVDYVQVERTVFIPAGSTTVYVYVQLLPHAFTRDGEFFRTSISNYTAGEVILGIAEVTVWR